MSATAPLVVTCDESGNDGENLLSGGSQVFAHASVTLPPDEAAEIMDEIRTRTGSQTAELKAKTILQPRHEGTAVWMLSHPSIDGNASVHLTHKQYFVVSKLFDSTAEELAHELGYDIYGTGAALAGANLLFFLAPQCYGTSWDGLLLQFQYFMRASNAGDAQYHLARLNRRMMELLSDEDALVRDVLGTVFAGFSHLRSLSKLQLGQGVQERLRTMDPLISAIGATVHFWGSSGRPIELVHDAAKELTPTKIEWVRRTLAHPEVIAPSRRGLTSELTNVRLVDSKDDPSVQVADLLAGIGRVVGESLIREQEHPLGRYLEPMLSGGSLWPIPANMDVTNARKVMENNLDRAW